MKLLNVTLALKKRHMVTMQLQYAQETTADLAYAALFDALKQKAREAANAVVEFPAPHGVSCLLRNDLHAVSLLDMAEIEAHQVAEAVRQHVLAARIKAAQDGEPTGFAAAELQGRA
jgi:hypothetical protein